MNNASTVPVQFTNVLFATDFSASSEAAFPYALSVARQYGGILYIAHVTTPDMYGYAPEESAPAMFQQIRRNAREKMAAFTSRQNFQGVPFETLFGEGEVWDTLEQWLPEHRIDLIVVGTHGRRGLKKLVMGSVAEELLRVATRPLLTVGPECPDVSGRPLRNLLYTTDFSPQALLARDYALSLAARYQARLTALHVIEDSPRSAEQRQQEEKSVIAGLHDLFPSGGNSVEVEMRVQFGHPAEQILKTASQQMSDLIVMSVRGAGATPRLATSFGSIAHRVISHAPCPVLTVRG
ncbi:MAG: universal stress protein [Candidatus Korobacteraceae bacterium]